MTLAGTRRADRALVSFLLRDAIHLFNFLDCLESDSSGTAGFLAYCFENKAPLLTDGIDLCRDQFQIAFQVLVKALISLDPGKDMDFLKQQFREFTAGLMSLPVNLPGTRLHRSLQASL